MQKESDVAEWQVSTYGRVTAGRILERYEIRLAQADLDQAIKNVDNIYHQLLQLPLKNVFNGLVLQQAKDVQIALQKMFVDYFLSGEDEKDEAAPGANLREDMRAEKEKLTESGNQFQKNEFAHYNLIADSQRSLIKFARAWRDRLLEQTKKLETALNTSVSFDRIMDTLNFLLVREDKTFSNKDWSAVEEKLKQKITDETKKMISQQVSDLYEFIRQHNDELEPFYEQITTMTQTFKEHHVSFQEMMSRVQTTMDLFSKPLLNSDHLQEGTD